jgi:hypothetical protein
MATLRELRTKAKELGITYEKDTTPDQLQEMIAGKMCEMETAPAAVAAPPPAAPPTRAPITVADPPVTEAAPPNRFTDEISINDDNLTVEFKNQASKFASHATNEATAKAKALVAKLRLETVDSEMTKKIREGFAARGEKATEKMISSEVVMSPEYQQAHMAWIDAGCNADIARGVKEAFTQRKDMLIQLGTAKRLEIEQTGMSLRDRAREVMAKAS